MSPEELENLNKRYNKALQKLNAEKGSINASIKDSKNKIAQLKADKDATKLHISNYNDLLAKAKEAKSKNIPSFDGMNIDEAIRLYENNIKSLQDKVRDADEQIEDIKEDAQRQQTNLDFLQKRVDARVNAVKENPEIKKQINEALGKNYQRKIKKDTQEKAEVQQKSLRILKIEESLKTHPDGGKHAGELIVNLMKVDTQPISEYKRISKIRDMKSKKGQDTSLEDSKLAQLKPKFDTAKQQVKDGLKEISNYKDLDIKMDDIELLKENASKDQKGEINLQGTLNRTTKRSKKQIKSYDKSIATYQIALENLGETEKTLNPEDKTTEKTEEAIEKQKNAQKQAQETISEPVQEQAQEPIPEPAQEQAQENPTSTKAKPMGRFRRLWENIKRFFKGNNTLPEGHTDKENYEELNNTTEQNINESKEENNNENREENKESSENREENNNENKEEQENVFKNSLKYNVVRDVMAEQKKEELKNANLQRKIQNTAKKEAKKDDDELNR